MDDGFLDKWYSRLTHVLPRGPDPVKTAVDEVEERITGRRVNISSLEAGG